jgi:hypothetical protein
MPVSDIREKYSIYMLEDMKVCLKSVPNGLQC